MTRSRRNWRSGELVPKLGQCGLENIPASKVDVGRGSESLCSCLCVLASHPFRKERGKNGAPPFFCEVRVQWNGWATRQMIRHSGMSLGPVTCGLKPLRCLPSTCAVSRPASLLISGGPADYYLWPNFHIVLYGAILNTVPQVAPSSSHLMPPATADP
jgi:hypothetical protein